MTTGRGSAVLTLTSTSIIAVDQTASIVVFGKKMRIDVANRQTAERM
jgi:hypothetical protein